MRSVVRIMSLCLAAMLGTPHPGWSLGLAARFGDVVVENAQIGATYNLRETLKIPFGIENRGNTDVEVVVEFLPPGDGHVLPEYEAIPDPNWLRAIPDRMTIGANAQGFFDLLLSIPDDQTLNGRHFQAIIVAKTVGTGLFSVAVENRLRFSVGPGPESLKEEKRMKALSQLDFDVSPQVLYVNDVPVGQTYDVRKETRKAIRVANYSVDPLSLRMMSEPWDKRLSMPAGYEPIPDPSWIRFNKSDQEIASEAIESFEIVFDVPDDAAHRGKKYAGLIRSGLTTGFWLDAPVRVFFTVKE